MTKRICAVLLVVIALLSLCSCMGNTKATEDEQSKDAAIRINAYLEDAGDYFTVIAPGKVVEGDVKKENVLQAYIDAATAKKDLPEELVNSYMESFGAYFEASTDASADKDESADDKELKEAAISLIKSEMVIHLAAEQYAIEIKPEDEKAIAEKLAKELGCEEEAIYTEGGDNYLVKCAIKEKLVTAELEKEWDRAHPQENESVVDSEEASSEESSNA